MIADPSPPTRADLALAAHAALINPATRFAERNAARVVIATLASLDAAEARTAKLVRDVRKGRRSTAVVLRDFEQIAHAVAVGRSVGHARRRLDMEICDYVFACLRAGDTIGAHVAASAERMRADMHAACAEAKAGAA